MKGGIVTAHMRNIPDIDIKAAKVNEKVIQINVRINKKEEIIILYVYMREDREKTMNA